MYFPASVLCQIYAHIIVYFVIEIANCFMCMLFVFCSVYRHRPEQTSMWDASFRPEAPRLPATVRSPLVILRQSTFCAARPGTPWRNSSMNSWRDFKWPLKARCVDARGWMNESLLVKSFSTSKRHSKEINWVIC